MASLKLKDIKKVYPNTEKKKSKKGEQDKKSNLLVTEEGVVAVQEFNLDIADKEFIVLVGPSGCGKPQHSVWLPGWKKFLPEICMLTVSGSMMWRQRSGISPWYFRVTPFIRI